MITPIKSCLNLIYDSCLPCYYHSSAWTLTQLLSNPSLLSPSDLNSLCKLLCILLSQTFISVIGLINVIWPLPNILNYSGYELMMCDSIQSLTLSQCFICSLLIIVYQTVLVILDEKQLFKWAVPSSLHILNYTCSLHPPKRRYCYIQLSFCIIKCNFFTLEFYSPLLATPMIHF